ncbi:MAG: hypothetical protein D4R68_02990 [Ignavibacteriales bacterium]|nr:MAG: hypothetical protein D4R68_02990 [Ignavibacteriales bacterium]
MGKKDIPPKKFGLEIKSISKQKQEGLNKKISELMGAGYPREVASEITKLEQVITDTETRRLNTAENGTLTEDIKEKKLLKSERTLKEATLRLEELKKEKNIEKIVQEEKPVSPEIKENEGELEEEPEEESEETKELREKVENRTAEIDKMMAEMNAQDEDEDSKKENEVKTPEKKYRDYESYKRAKNREEKKELNGPVKKLVDDIFQYGKEKEEESLKEKAGVNTETKKLSEEEKEISAIKNEYDPKIEKLKNELVKLENEGQNETKENNEKQKCLDAIENAIKTGNKEKQLKFEKEFYEKFATVDQTEQTQAETSTITPEKIGELEKLIARCESKKQQALESDPNTNKILKGINWYENWGKDKDGNPEKGFLGFTKRMTKLAANLALIGVCSMGSVEVLAKFGKGSASALAGGIGSKLGMKMAMGLGLSGIMDVGGGKLPAHIKKWMPLYMGAFGVTLAAGIALGGGALAAGALTSGAIAGGASAFGYISSKFMPKFATQKIETKEKDAINKMLEKYKIGPLDENKSKQAEEEYAKIIKHYQKVRIFGKLADGAIKLATGTAIAGAIMEVSGTISDHHTAEVKAEHDANQARHEVAVKHITELKEQHLKHEAEMKAEHTGINQTTESSGIQEFMKTNSTQEAVKLGMYNPGASAESMIVQHGTLSFDDGHGHRIEVDYSPRGAIQTIADLKIKILQEYGDITKVPHGNLSTHYVDMKGVEHDQSLIQNQSNIETVEKYHGDMFDSDKSNTTTPHDNNFDNQQPIKIDDSTDEFIKQQPIHVDGSVNDIDNQSPIYPIGNVNDQQPIHIDGSTTEHGSNNDLSATGTENPNHPTLDQQVETQSTLHALSPQVEHIYESNIHKMFPDEKSLETWNLIKDSTGDRSAQELMSWNVLDEKGNPDVYSPLVSELHELHAITGEEPIGETALHPAETLEEYRIRTYQIVEEIGKLDEIKK